jgi:predicted O-methyltransferase YrrM
MTPPTTTHSAKLRQLIPLIVCSPSEFIDRMHAKLEVRADRWRAEPLRYRAHSLVDALLILGAELGGSVGGTLQEGGFNFIKGSVLSGMARLEAHGPISATHNGDMALGSTVYFACRALQPKVVIETGVAYGVTSAFVLQALAVNGNGELWSIDLPPLGRDAQEYVGALVPIELRDRWHLRRGVSRRLLPGIVEEAGTIDMFIHDSLHTHSNMQWEFETVWPFLRPGGLLIADDIENNGAFGDFAEKVAPSSAIVIEEQGKGSLLGVLRKPYEVLQTRDGHQRSRPSTRRRREIEI